MHPNVIADDSKNQSNSQAPKLYYCLFCTASLARKGLSFYFHWQHWTQSTQINPRIHAESSRTYFGTGWPVNNCSFVVAHVFLHSGMHSFLDFCSSPLGFVHSKMHWLKHASKLGSFLVPLTAGSTSFDFAKAGVAPEKTTAAVEAQVVWRNDRRFMGFVCWVFWGVGVDKLNTELIARTAMKMVARKDLVVMLIVWFIKFWRELWDSMCARVMPHRSRVKCIILCVLWVCFCDVVTTDDLSKSVISLSLFNYRYLLHKAEILQTIYRYLQWNKMDIHPHLVGTFWRS